MGNSVNTRKQILETLHASALGGHSGQSGSIKRISSVFYWPHMKNDIIQFVQQCPTCQRTKHENLPYPGLLQPLPIPERPWLHINMDFVGGLPISEHCDTILVVVDRLTKMGHFMAVAHPFSAKDIAQVFLDSILKLHGMPATIVSDRDKVFTSLFWKELFNLLGTTLHYSTAYHPQTDGQSERLIQCLEAYLRSMCADRPSSWILWLPLAEWWYNTNFHTGIKMTPYEACYGYKPIPIPLGDLCEALIPAVSNMVKDRQAMVRLLHDHLAQAQNRMKQYADLNRTERHFDVGDWVYVKLQPYRQQSVELRSQLKLSSKFFGPYLILEKIGEVAYRLQLPEGSRIHPIFHVSRLKRHVGEVPNMMPELPVVNEGAEIIAYPEA